MKKDQKERSESCGQAIIDFINADTTDDACISLIPKLQYLNGFSNRMEEEINNILHSELILAHSGLWYDQQVIKIIINRAINGIRLDGYHPLMRIVQEVKGKYAPTINIHQDGNIEFKEKDRTEQGFFQYYLPPSKRNENRDYNVVGANVIRLYRLAIYEYFLEYLKTYGNIKRFHKCKMCEKYFISKTKREVKFCSDNRRSISHL